MARLEDITAVLREFGGIDATNLDAETFVGKLATVPQDDIDSVVAELVEAGADAAERRRVFESVLQTLRRVRSLRGTVDARNAAASPSRAPAA